MYREPQENCLVHCFFNVGGQPVEALVQTLSSCTTAALNVPVALAQSVESQLLRHLRRTHRVRQILLVREYEQRSVAQLVFNKHLIQLRFRVFHTVPVVTIHYEDNTVRVLVVVAPQRAEFVLATNVPHGELQVLVLKRLHIEANGWYRRHNLTQFQLVKNGGLTRGIEADHEDAHLLLSEQRRKPASHC